MTPTAHGWDDADTTSAADHAELLKTTAIKTVPTIVPVSSRNAFQPDIGTLKRKLGLG